MITVWGETLKLITIFVTVLGCIIYTALPHVLPSLYDYRPATTDGNKTMVAMTYSLAGDGNDARSSLLELNDSYPMPQLRDTDLLIAVKAAALNPMDFKYM
eukprot:5503266-Ditylum_brightwellii.AAC.1